MKDARRNFTYEIKRSYRNGNIKEVLFHRADGATVVSIQKPYGDGKLYFYAAAYNNPDGFALLGEITTAVYGENKVPEWQAKEMFSGFAGWGWYPMGELSPEDVARIIALERGENDITEEFLLCTWCGEKTRTKVRTNTELRNFPLFCPKCHHTKIVDYFGGKLTEVVS